MTLDMEQPAFLRRLKAETAGQPTENRYIATRNKKTAVDELEDEPSYVMEDGQQLTAAEFKKLSEGGADLEPEGTKSSSSIIPQTAPERQTEATIGVRKRKLAKTIGPTEEDQREEYGDLNSTGKPTKDKDDSSPKTGNITSAPKNKKAKTKKKAVKLSFDE